MRNCGVGHRSLEKFCGLMNMPQPMRRKFFDVISNKVCDAAEKVAKASMLTAALDLKSGSEGMTGISVTVDGTWQKQGFSSIKVAQPIKNNKNRQKYAFPDFCLILIFNPRTTFCENLRVKKLAVL